MPCAWRRFPYWGRYTARPSLLYFPGYSRPLTTASLFLSLAASSTQQFLRRVDNPARRPHPRGARNDSTPRIASLRPSTIDAPIVDGDPQGFVSPVDR